LDLFNCNNDEIELKYDIKNSKLFSKIIFSEISIVILTFNGPFVIYTSYYKDNFTKQDISIKYSKNLLFVFVYF
jgi:hypothetical protein